ncbi:MAG: exonuclease domain-containing protein [Bacteroidota bacterium]|nr:exonuclease domain-containing protein [Bacteroidota bacterium]
MKFAVVDIETTGLNLSTDRITEVGVVIIENFRVTATYSKLVNAGVPVPANITQLTGINDKLLSNAGDFALIAEELNELTKGCIIVGQHVQFDYSFLKDEMRCAGIAFTRKTLCTAEFAKLLHPGLRSYSLASLCKHFNIINTRPHRALPDAEATAAIFLIMADEKGHDFFELLFNTRTVSQLIPVHLRETVYKKLPATPGVYYFIGKNNKPVYIGKAAKIKNRVLSHFRGEGNSLKILATASAIKEIRFQETGNELLAALLEDHEIRHYWPGLNSAQKKTISRYGIVHYKDQRNQWRMGITRAGKQHCFTLYFHQYHLATEYIRARVNHYALDSFLCGLPSGQNVAVDDHNRNFDVMIKEDQENKSASVYFSKGRTEQEKGFIWVEKGRYKGFGFIPEGAQLSDAVFQDNLTLRYSSITSESIIGNLIKKETPAFTFRI